MEEKLRAKDIIRALESHAPLYLQESYDNSGLQIGDEETEINKALLCLDVTEEILEEAMHLKCNMIISHHPLFFHSIKRITNRHYVERIAWKAIMNQLVIYSMHTNLDQVLKNGVNEVMAQKLTLKNTTVLRPSGNLVKLEVFIPTGHIDVVTDAMFAAGAGKIGQYDQCGFNIEGKGTFRPLDGAVPFLGEVNKKEEVQEIKWEGMVSAENINKVIEAMKQVHPYEEPAYFISSLQQKNRDIGSGALGYLSEPIEKEAFLRKLKETFGVEVVKFTQSHQTFIRKVAICGGSGSFLLNDAIRAGADAFITSDVKYHDFFEADKKIMYCDIGHFETEQFTHEAIAQILSEKLPTFATIFAKTRTNPVNYF